MWSQCQRRVCDVCRDKRTLIPPTVVVQPYSPEDIMDFSEAGKLGLTSGKQAAPIVFVLESKHRIILKKSKFGLLDELTFFFVFFFSYKAPPLPSLVFCRIASFLPMAPACGHKQRAAKVTVWPRMAAEAHLHILMRIDMLLPCLNDLSCLFMCAGFSMVIMSRYRPVPESWWHLLYTDRKGRALCVCVCFNKKDAF